ncbi:MAG TPA: hypothetical protein VEF04_14405 [Blastocatellia bacterium]|nr:hypothetical protein [Blastocatellia bacterium]
MKGQMQAWWTELNGIRSHAKKPRDISFRQFLREKAQSQQDSQENLTPGHVIKSLGFDPQTVFFSELAADQDGFFVCAEIVRQAIDRGMRGLTLKQELQHNKMLDAIFSQAPILSDPASRYVVPEYFAPFINRGVVQGQYWDALISADIGVPQPKVTMPLMQLSDAALEERAEAATIKEGSVIYGSKDVKIKERAKAIYFSDESVMFNRIDLVSVFFEDLGRMLASGLNGEAVRVLRDGDQADGSEAATVIGASVSGTFDYTDVVRVMIRMGMIGRPVTQIVAGEDMANLWENLPEVKNNQNNGGKLLQTTVRGVTRPQNWELFPAFNIPANKILFSDPNQAMVALTAKPLTLEQDRIVARKLNGTFASVWKGFAIQQATARVIVDKSIAFSGNGWTSAFSGNQETW